MADVLIHRESTALNLGRMRLRPTAWLMPIFRDGKEVPNYGHHLCFAQLCHGVLHILVRVVPTAVLTFGGKQTG